MLNRSYSAKDIKNLVEKQAEKEKQIQTQLNELHKQTSNIK